MMKAEIVDTVRYYRKHGFFQNEEDKGEVTGDEPGFAQVEIGLPLAAYASMSDEAIAEFILSRDGAMLASVSEGGGNIDFHVLLYDPFRVHYFDTECAGPGEEAYVDCLHALRRISRGAFLMTEPAETWGEADDSPVVVSFLLQDRRMEFELEAMSDWMDVSIIARVNEIISDSGFQFYAWETGGQDEFVVCLTAAERARIEVDRNVPFRRVGEESAGTTAAEREELLSAFRDAVEAERSGRRREALERYGVVVARAEELRERFPSDGAFSVMTEVMGREKMAGILCADSDVEAAIRELQMARVLAQSLYVTYPARRKEYKVALAYPRVVLRLGILMAEQRLADTALKYLDEAIESLSPWLEDSDLAEAALHNAALGHESRADVLTAAGRIDEAVAAYAAAEIAMEKYFRMQPPERRAPPLPPADAHPEEDFSLAWVRLRLLEKRGFALADAHREREATPFLSEAIGLAKEVAPSEPLTAQWIARFRKLVAYHGAACLVLAETRRARDSLLQAAESGRRLLMLQPGDLLSMGQQGIVLLQLAKLHHAFRDMRAAEHALGEAAAYFEAIRQHAPQDADVVAALEEIEDIRREWAAGRGFFRRLFR